MTVTIENEGVAAGSFVTDQQQAACFDHNSPTVPQCAGNGGGPCTSGKPILPCTKAELAKIKPELQKTLDKGRTCMEKVGFKGLDPQGKDLTLAAIGSLDFLCSQNTCDPFGSLSLPTKNGRHGLMVNLAKGDPAGLASTLFHEVLHSDGRFIHDNDLVDRSSRACKTQLADRTYACEAMCFSKTPSRCDCIKCLTPEGGKSTKEICETCKGYGSCGTGRPNTSSDVGAWCAKNRTFCDTKVECDSDCGAFGPCTPVRATCDDQCN